MSEFKIERGVVESVDTVTAGEYVAADVAAGETVIPMENVSAFITESGTGRLAYDLDDYHPYYWYEYVVDEEASTITVTDEPLYYPLEKGQFLHIFPTTQEQKRAQISMGEGDAIDARVPFHLYPLLADGIRRETDREAVEVIRSGDDYVVFDVVWKPPVIDGSLIDPDSTIPVEALTDGVGPASSPAVFVTSFGVGGLRVMWSPVPNNDTVTYEVFASLTSPVTTADELVGTTTGTSLSFSKLDGEQIPLDGVTPVYVAVRARDADDVAVSLGTEASGLARAADLEMINVGQLNANTIEAMQAYFSEVSADIVLASGKIVVGDASSSHIEIDPGKGLILYGPDGQEVLVNLDMTDAQLSEFTGRINASQLSVLNGLELRSALSTIANNAVLTLVAVVADPKSPPSLSTGPKTMPWAAPPSGWAEWAAYFDSGSWYQLIYNPDVNTARVRTIDSTGAVTANIVLASNSTRLQPMGLVKLGTSFWVLRRNNSPVGTRYWFLCEYNTSGSLISQGAVARENKAGLTALHPTLGTDGTNLIVATPDPGKVRLHWYSLDEYWPTADMATFPPNSPQTATAWSVVDGPLSSTHLRFIGIDNFDYGAKRLVVADTDGFVRVNSGTTYTTPVTSFTVDSPRAMAWDGANFFTFHDSNSKRRYSGFKGTTTASRTFWVQYSWEDGALATKPSPAASIVLPDRRYVYTNTPTPGAGTATGRVFIGTGTTKPANGSMNSLTTYSSSTTSFMFSAPSTSTTHPRTASDFTSGTPGQIATEAGGFVLRGDGTGAWPLLDLSSKFQAGKDVTVPSGSGGVNVSVTFPKPFPAAPAVTLGISHPNLDDPRITTSSTTGFTARFDRSGAATYSFDWIAVVP